MKVTHIGTLPPIKGVSDYCLELTKELSKKVKIKFISFKKIYPDFLYPGGTTDKDKDFKYSKNKNLQVYNTLTYYNPFTWIMAGLRADKIVHIQWWTTYLFPIFFTICMTSKLMGKKIIFTLHNILGHESGSVDKLLNKIILLFGDRYIVHSKENKRQLIHFFRISKNKIDIIHHGIYSFYKTEKLSKNDARIKLGFIKKDKILLVFGNIRGYKGVDIILKAMETLVKRIKNLKLVIAGKSWIDWDENFRIIKKHGLEKHIKTNLDFIPMSMVQYYFKACDLVVLPYKKFEAQSGPGNIALAFGKPLVVTNTGGLPELVVDKNMVAKTNNVESLVKIIRGIFKNKGKIEQLANDSKKLSEKYSWKKATELTMEIYSKI